MDPLQAMRNAIREELQIDQPLPPLFDEAIELFSKFHIYYRTYKHVQIYRNGDKDSSKGHPAVYGAALQLLGDYTSIGSYAVNVALVTKCAEDILREYHQLGDTYQSLCEAVNWQYPLYQSIEWKREATSSQEPLSPSLYLIWQVQIMGLVRQILKITRCALDVLWQMFKLSMCLCDAYLLCNNDTQTRYEACTELVAEWDHYQSQLKEDQKRLAEELEKGSGLADRILMHLGIENDTTFIIDQLKEKIEDLAEELEDIYDVAEETLDTIYVKGKITPLHINLAEGKTAIPKLPDGRFPPWAGQTVLIVPLPPPSKSTLKPVENFLLDNVDHLFMTDSLKGIIQLAECIHQFYQKQSKATPSFSHFA